MAPTPASRPATPSPMSPPPTSTPPPGRAHPLLDIRRIFAEPAALASARGRQVLDRWPGAEVVEVPSHWDIPELHGNEGNVERWVRVKAETLVLGVKKSLTARPNGRSSHFVAPSTANGCAMACAYCYVPRRKGYANPITVFTNIEQITGYLRRHVARQGIKPADWPSSAGAGAGDPVDPVDSVDQIDPHAWVYDLGENSDCSVDATVSDNVADLIATFRELPTAKASFATKFVNRDLLALDPRGRTRIRFSLMPDPDAKLLDIRTSPVAERIAAAADFVEAGYEVHLNFSPVVLRAGWDADWAALLRRLDDELPTAVKAQAACEVILLTHNRELHDVNLGWHPKAEDVLWRPELQQPKRSQTGGWNVRYRNAPKAAAVARVRELIAAHAPWLRVRYAF
ncbi:MAG: spore photoproduct lyase family protein [Kineosporiaceae bacterium]